MKVSLTTDIDLPPELVWREVQTPGLLVHIAWPLIQFRFIDPANAINFEEQDRFRVSLRLGGLIPLGEQWIVPSIHEDERTLWPKRLRDNGYSNLIRTWDHCITVAPDGQGGTRYRDEVEVKAGMFTPLVWLFAQLFYRHRQRRWRGLSSTIYARMLVAKELTAFEEAKADNDEASAWGALERVHIISQPFGNMHLSSHWQMLRYAWTLRDGTEIVGQITRLALAPIGNLTGKLPICNTGRANVSAFKPMDVPEDLSVLLTKR